MEIELSANVRLRGAGNLLIEKPFNNIRWRKMVDEACRLVDRENLGFSVISPWGFELLENRSFLSKNLRRFYCYIGVPKGHELDKRELAAEFYIELEKLLKQYEPAFLKQIVVAIEQDRLRKLRPDNYECEVLDKLVDVQVRYVGKDIITDYAEYVILSLAGIANEKAECQSYETNRMHRSRMFQLYIMIEQLFGFLQPFSPQEQLLFNSIYDLIDNMIQQFYMPKLSEIPLNKTEKSIINDLIFPRIRLFIQFLQQGRDFIRLKGKGYHFEDDLELTLSQECYDKVVKKICQTYINFV